MLCFNHFSHIESETLSITPLYIKSMLPSFNFQIGNIFRFPQLKKSVKISKACHQWGFFSLDVTIRADTVALWLVHPAITVCRAENCI